MCFAVPAAAPSGIRSSSSGSILRCGNSAWHGAAAVQQRAAPRRAPVLCSLPEDDLDAQLISGASPLRRLSSLQRSRSSASSSSEPSSDSEAAARVEEEVQEVQAHKKAAVQQAFINGSLGFGFSAGGLVFPYYVGLVSSLVQAGVLRRPSQLAGSSAGSLIAASFNAGLDMPTLERSMIEFGEDCLRNGTRYRLGPLLREFLHAYLPDDAHEACSGCTHVAVTRLLPYWQQVMVSHFTSRDDLIEALLTSCHIPWYVDGRWMTKFRGHYCVDGGVMAFIPTVPAADYTVKVLCFPGGHLSRLKASTANNRSLKRLHRLLDIDITMDTFEEWPHDLTEVVKWALVASAQETSSLLIEKGKRDGLAWFEAMELAPLVAAKQEQEQAQQDAQQQQQQPEVRLGWGADPERQQQQQAAQQAQQQQQQPCAGGGDADAAGWADDKAQERELEARTVEAKAAAAEQAAGSSDPAAAAAAAGAPGQAIKHAAEAVDLAGQPPGKRHKAAAAAATAAAVADGAASTLGDGQAAGGSEGGGSEGGSGS